MRLVCAGLVLAWLPSCLPQQLFDPNSGGTAVVPTSSFGTPGPTTPGTHVVASGQASTDLCCRVDLTGKKILSSNPQSGLRPCFATDGSPKPEIFHQGISTVHITDSLVKECQTEGQLAAVLALELAKMVVEREALANPRGRGSDRLPPMEVPIGNAGQAGAVDAVRMAELARFEKDRREMAQQAPVLDPQVLAARFLTQSGYSPAELEAVQPLLKQAAGNYVLEKHFKAQSAGWGPQYP
jgi:hypothetical protein